MKQHPLGNSSAGLPPHIAAMFCYLWVIGVIFLIVEKENKFVRFHALQSTLFWLLWIPGAVLVGFIPLLNVLLLPLYVLGGLTLMLILMLAAYQGKWYMVPRIGEYARKKVA